MSICTMREATIPMQKPKAYQFMLPVHTFFNDCSACITYLDFFPGKVLINSNISSSLINFVLKDSAYTDIKKA